MILLVMTVVQRGVGFVRAVLFCRWLDPEQLGLWDMAWSFLMLAGPLAVVSLPGTFGRYAEHFRARGQLRSFLQRTIVFCAMTAIVAVAALWICRGPLAATIFGSSSQAWLLGPLGLTLLCVVGYNYVTSFFTALRQVRLVACLDLLNSLAFAAIGVALLAAWRCNAGSVVLAYGVSCGLCCLAAGVAMRRIWTSAPAATGETRLWRKLLPFAAWILVINLLTNAFALADRAMIVHFAPGSTEDALALVGQYHSARVVPLLLVTIAGVLSGILLPHLAHDWEAGRRDRVSLRLNLLTKLMLAAMTAGALGVLGFAPWLFDWALAGKYAAGRAVLPQTLVYCIWFGATMIAQQYLWCAERAGRVCLALGVGLAVNVLLNLVLLPRFGLHGAVCAAAGANLLTLAAILLLSYRLGLWFDRGLWAFAAMPLALLAGPWFASAALIGAAVLCWSTDWLFSTAEKAHMANAVDRYRDRLEQWRSA